MNRLRERHLELGRGRVYAPDPGERWDGWFVDYRDLEGSVYGVWAESIADAHDWIREQARHAGH